MKFLMLSFILPFLTTTIAQRSSTQNYFPSFQNTNFFNLRSTDCSSSTVAGLYQVGEELSTVLYPSTTPTYIQLSFNLYFIDNWSSTDTFQILMNNTILSSITLNQGISNYANSALNTDLCGNISQPDSAILFSVTTNIESFSLTLTEDPISLTLKSVQQTLESNATSIGSSIWAMRNLQVSFITCPIGCSDCFALLPSSCTACSAGYYQTPSLVDGAVICVASCPSGFGINQDACIACEDQNCYNCTSNIGQCQQCKAGYYLNELGVCSKNCSQEYFKDDSTYKCVQTCPTETVANVTSGMCEICLRPKTVNIVGQCVFCGANCNQCDTQNKCISCLEGYTLTSNQCFLPNSESTVFESTNKLITTIMADQPGKHATWQVMIFTSASTAYLSWFLIAESVLPDIAQYTCQQLASNASNLTNVDPSIYQSGVVEPYTESSTNPSTILNLTSLRANISYTTIICATSSKETSKFENLTAQFQTKTSGYSIQKLSLFFDNPIDTEGANKALCNIVSITALPSSRILTSTGKECDISNSRRIRILTGNQDSNSSTTQLDVLIYGDISAEVDNTANDAVQNVVNSFPWSNFSYVNQNGQYSTVKYILNQGKISSEYPRLISGPELILSGQDLYISNIITSEDDGFIYAYLEEKGTETSGVFSSNDIIQFYITNGSSTSSLIRTESKNKGITLKMTGLSNYSSYNLKLFTTTQDPTSFSIKSPEALFSILASAFLPQPTSQLNKMFFILAEVSALVMLILVWYLIFKRGGRVKTAPERTSSMDEIRQRVMESFSKKVFSSYNDIENPQISPEIVSQVHFKAEQQVNKPQIKESSSQKLKSNCSYSSSKKKRLDTIEESEIKHTPTRRSRPLSLDISRVKINLNKRFINTASTNLTSTGNLTIRKPKPHDNVSSCASIELKMEEYQNELIAINIPRVESPHTSSALRRIVTDAEIYEGQRKKRSWRNWREYEERCGSQKLAKSHNNYVEECQA